MHDKSDITKDMEKKDKIPTRINAELIYYQLAEIKTQLQDFKANYVTKEESSALKHEIEELRKDVQELKGKKMFRDTILWVGLTASAIINIIVIYNFFNREG
jgi:hypothetical protein